MIDIGLPIIVRPAFTLGGRGGGIARTPEEFRAIVRRGLDASPIGQILLDESVIGWGEFELEVMRDHNDNCVIVCSIENIDPMGVHTGDSVTVAPQQTLTDRLYQQLRDQAFTVIRAVGVETGGSNVQFAVNPVTEEIMVIEMNPRVSRSLGAGLQGDRLSDREDRRAPGRRLRAGGDRQRHHAAHAGLLRADDRLRRRQVAALRLREVLRRRRAPDHAHEVRRRGDGDRAHVPAGVRARRCAAASWTPMPSVERLAWRSCSTAWRCPARTATTCCSRRFAAGAERRGDRAAHEDRPLVPARAARSSPPTPRRRSPASGRTSPSTPARPSSPPRRRTTTRAGSVRVAAPTRSAAATSRASSSSAPGPNRIGQGIEFDYCCVHAAMTVRESGRDAVMVNCNPETVSTDYDTSDRLYFEPLTLEDVLGVVEIEQPEGVIVQFGGQTPLKLAAGLQDAGVPILGTSVDAIDLAEDRGRFGALLGAARLQGAALRHRARRRRGAGGLRAGRLPAARAPELRARRARDGDRLLAPRTSPTTCAARAGPAPATARDLPRPLPGERDRGRRRRALRRRDVWIGGIMQHVEEAGIHSGDSACVLPPHSLGPGDARRDPRAHARHRARAGHRRADQHPVRGHARRRGCSSSRPTRAPRAPCRSSPRRSACRWRRWPAGSCSASASRTSGCRRRRWPTDHVCVKEAVLPFDRFTGSDALLGPEMRSTGEVMGVARDFPTAFAKAQAAAGALLPSEGTVFITLTDGDKAGAYAIASRLEDLGFRIVATRRHGAGDPRHGRARRRRAQEGRRGLAERRRLHRGRRGRPRHQHADRLGRARRRLGDPPRRGRPRDPLHHDAVGRPRRRARDLRRAQRRADGAVAAGAAPRPPAASDEAARAARPPARRGRRARRRRRLPACCTPTIRAGRRPRRASSTCSPPSSAGARARTSGPTCRARSPTWRGARRPAELHARGRRARHDTAWPSCEADDELWLTGPLGEGFREPSDGRRAILAGGGVGVPPLRALAGALDDPRVRVDALLGFRDAHHARVAERSSTARACRSPPTTARSATTASSPSCWPPSSTPTTTRSSTPAGRPACSKRCARCAPPATCPRSSRWRPAWPAASAPATAASCRVRDGGYVRLCVDGPVLDADRLDLVPGALMRAGRVLRPDARAPDRQRLGHVRRDRRPARVRRRAAGRLPVQRVRLQDDHAGAARRQPAAAAVGGAGRDDQLDRPAQPRPATATSSTTCRSSRGCRCRSSRTSWARRRPRSRALVEAVDARARGRRDRAQRVVSERRDGPGHRRRPGVARRARARRAAARPASR